jgi:predicted transcriptional regulator
MAKLTLQLSPELESILDEYAEEHDVSKVQIIRDAVKLMKYLEDEIEDDREILVRDPATGVTERLMTPGAINKKIRKTAALRRANELTN